MLEIKKVLFTTDFSEAAHEAIPHALEIARRFDARLVILHCRTLFTDDPRNIEFQFLDEDKYEEFLQQNLRAAADKVGSSVRFSTAITRNISPASGIVDYCSENNIDLVVMATHGRTALGHFFLGSVAEKVVRYAPCRVMTVRRRDGAQDRPVYENIVIPFDFSVHSNQAARFAVELAQKYAARLHVFYSLEQEVHPAFFGVWRESIEGRLGEITENVEKALAHVLGADTARSLDIEVRIGQDRSDREIVNYVKHNAMDLVVMGTHGLSGIEHALLGSTTERVVRTSPVPVLTLKAVEQMSSSGH